MAAESTVPHLLGIVHKAHQHLTGKRFALLLLAAHCRAAADRGEGSAYNLHELAREARHYAIHDDYHGITSESRRTEAAMAQLARRARRAGIEPTG